MSIWGRSAKGVVSVIAISMTSFACSSKPSESNSTGSATAQSSANTSSRNSVENVVRESNFGTAKISGRVVLEGDPPEQANVPVPAGGFCVAAGMVGVAPEYQVGEGGGLPHTFVYIKKGIEADYSAPKEAKVLNQTGCMYEPHIFGIHVGQTLKIRNNDAINHNAHPLTKRNGIIILNQAQNGGVAEISFNQPEIMVKIKCDVHSWMDAYCGVLDHPFFTVTDENGNFEIDKLPPGYYMVEAWHELHGVRQVELTIAAGESVTADVTFNKR